MDCIDVLIWTTRWCKGGVEDFLSNGRKCKCKAQWGDFCKCPQCNHIPWYPRFGVACRLHENVDVAKEAIEFIIKLKPQKETTYVLSSNIYVVEEAKNKKRQQWPWPWCGSILHVYRDSFADFFWEVGLFILLIWRRIWLHCIFFGSKDWRRVFLTYLYLQRLTTVICSIWRFCIRPLATVILIPMEDIFSTNKHLGVVVLPNVFIYIELDIIQ